MLFQRADSSKDPALSCLFYVSILAFVEENLTLGYVYFDPGAHYYVNVHHKEEQGPEAEGWWWEGQNIFKNGYSHTLCRDLSTAVGKSPSLGVAFRW